MWVDYYLNGSSILSQRVSAIGLGFGSDPTPMPDDPRNMDFFYDESGNLFGFSSQGQEYFYLRNGQNDIVGILDSTGDLVVQYSYDSWGKLISVTDGNGNDKSAERDFLGNLNPFRYRGYYYDFESGFYYLNSRYYDPEV